MTATDPRIERFLSAVKSAGRSSPAGLHWHEFYEFLRARKQTGLGDPPVPLILAASGESSASKHSRLSGQLEWALENGCIDEAIRYLERIPVEKWNSCLLDQWGRTSYDF
jgi:hypothetical protein